MVTTTTQRLSAYVLSMGSILLLGFAGSSTTLAQTTSDAPEAPSMESLFQEIPTEARNALVVGQPEYALRVLLESFNSQDNLSPSIQVDHSIVAQRQLFRAVFEYAIEFRCDQDAEGAVFEMIRMAPQWAHAEKSKAAQQLVKLWRSDAHPTRNELARRLKQFKEIQLSLKPGPLDPELPITLTLLALDAVDVVDDPIELIALLEMANTYAPGADVFASYQPDDFFMKRAAEQMQREHNYLAAGEIYRRLIYLSSGNEALFQRYYSNNQLARIYALVGIAGADYAIQAAARLREDYLEPSELGRFRVLKENLRHTIGQNREVRQIPRTVTSEMRLGPLAVGYRANDRIFVQEGGHLIFEPGSILRGNARIILEGGKVTFNGTPDKPIIIIGAVIESDDSVGGGVITGSYVQFRDCAIRRDPTKPVFADGFTWKIDHAAFVNCQLPMDRLMSASFENCSFESCQLTVPANIAPTNVSTAAKADGDTRQQMATFVRCEFDECKVDNIIPIRATRSAFINCEITQWDTIALWMMGQTDESALAEPEYGSGGSNEVTNFFAPTGAIPAAINLRSVFETGAGPIQIAPRVIVPQLGLGKVPIWVE